MKSRLSIVIAAFTMIGLMFSCSTSNDVASNRGIQKRKYTKGFHVEKSTKMGGKNQQNEVVEVELTNDNEEAPVLEDDLVRDLEKEVVTVEEVNTNETLTETPESIEETTPVEEQVEVTELETTPRERTSLKDKLLKRSKKVVHTVKSAPQKIARESSESGLMLVLLVLLALFLPPLAVLIYDGVDRPFWIDLILFLVAIGVGSILFGATIGYLCGLIAVIYALLVIFEVV